MRNVRVSLLQLRNEVISLRKLGVGVLKFIFLSSIHSFIDRVLIALFTLYYYDSLSEIITFQIISIKFERNP